MAGFMEKILNKFSITDEDDLEDFDDFDDELPAKKERKPEYPARTEENAPVMRKDTVKGPTTVTTAKPVATRQSRIVEDDFDDFQEKKERPKPVERPANRVVPMRSARIMEVSVMRPTRFDDSQAICDLLVSESATIVNLEGIDITLAQRIMDFVSGAVYSLNGKIHQISNLIFIVSPENVEISGDYLSYIEQNGFEVPTLNR